jgi:hypothetical protein
MATRLGKYTDEELLAELERRKQEAPVPLVNPDFTKVRKLVIDYVENNHVKDIEHYIFEEAVNAVYGLNYDIWNYINHRTY